MNINKAVALALLALAACGQRAQEPVANQSEAQANAAEDPQKAAAVPSLAGAWSIAQINGKAPDQVWPMNVHVTDTGFAIASECRTLAWTLTQKGNLVQFKPDPGSSRDCARVRSPAEEVVEKPVDLANIAMFSDGGRSVELSGPGGRLTMTRR